jgi:hypothetical protein
MPRPPDDRAVAYNNQSFAYMELGEFNKARDDRAPSNQGVSGPPMVLTAVIAQSLAAILGDCETREGAGQQRRPAVQQKRELPEVIIEIEILKGDAECPAHLRLRVIDSNRRNLDFRDQQRNGGKRGRASQNRFKVSTHGFTPPPG